jgi:sorbitol-specific phosphotransferase system component IIBC
LRALGGIFLAALSIGVSFGLAAVAEVLGARVREQAAGLARTAWGTILLALACALPFVGWFGMLPYSASLGLGGFILSFFSRPAAE